MSGVIFHTLLILLALALIGTLVWIGVFKLWLSPKKRKAFLIKEMTHCLQTREAIYGSEIINYCRTILHNLTLHCSMSTGFQQTYTYGDHEIGVNWYPLNGHFEFTLKDNFSVIARIHYPG